jgi:hypothetical protein
VDRCGFSVDYYRHLWVTSGPLEARPLWLHPPSWFCAQHDLRSAIELTPQAQFRQIQLSFAVHNVHNTTATTI